MKAIAARMSGSGRGSTLLLAAGVICTLGACSTMRPAVHHQVPSPPPPPPAELEPHRTSPFTSEPPSSAVPKGCADEKCAARVQARHRQYYDTRRKRYYFYDPAKRAYFWEDGSPRS